MYIAPHKWVLNKFCHLIHTVIILLSPLCSQSNKPKVTQPVSERAGTSPTVSNSKSREVHWKVRVGEGMACCHVWRQFWLSPIGAVLLEPSVQKQAMLLNIIRCTGEPPSAKYYLAQMLIALLDKTLNSG